MDSLICKIKIMKEVIKMQMTKNKNAVMRFAAAILAAITLTITFAFGTMSVKALAADEPVITEEITAAEDSSETTNDTYESDFNSAFAADGFSVQPVADSNESFEIVALSSASASGSADADAAYKKVINFFITWLRRIGAMVALIGAIMFGLAIKNNDAEQKQAALITMVVWAVCLGADMFNLFE